MEKLNDICSVDEGLAIGAIAVRQTHFNSGLSMDASGTENSLASSRSMPDELESGEVLDGRFKIVGIISRGGMACIYRATDFQTGQTVAVKVPFFRFESDPGFYSRFQREENIGLTLDHPDVLKMLPAVSEKSRPYIVMEYLEGQTLAARLRQESPLPEAEAVRVAIQICAGLDYLHRKGVAHRDLKPENVMLCNNSTIRIMDFGIAKSQDSRRLTFGSFSAPMGTPDYIAPEQVQGKRGDARTDIYALGAMLYEMTTGFPLYQGDNLYVVMNARLTGDPEAPRSRNPLLSLQIEEIILHALERNPSKRFPSAAVMKAELNDYSEVSLTDRFKKLQPSQIWKARLPLLPKMFLIVMVQIALFFLLFWWFSHRSHHNGPTSKETQRAVTTAPQPR
jgi:serine/threonine protein kinase